MEIDSILDDCYSDGKYLHFNDAAVWNGKEVTLQDQAKSGESSFAKTILAKIRMHSSERSLKISPMDGSATVSAEKDSDGNTTLEADVTVSSDDGTFEVTASGSVDQDGNTSGKVEASINWEKD